MSTLEWSSGDERDLNARVAQLQTFVRMLEKDVQHLDPSHLKDRLTRNEQRLENIEKKLDSLQSGLDELDEVKAVTKLINPRALAMIASLLLGGRGAGSSVVDHLTEEAVNARQAPVVRPIGGDEH